MSKSLTMSYISSVGVAAHSSSIDPTPVKCTSTPFTSHLTNVNSTLQSYFHFPNRINSLFLELKYILQKRHKKSLLVSKQKIIAKKASSPHLSPQPTNHPTSTCSDSICLLEACDDQGPKPEASIQPPLFLAILPRHRLAGFPLLLPLGGPEIAAVFAITAGIH